MGQPSSRWARDSGPGGVRQVRFCTAPNGARIAYAAEGSGPALLVPAAWISHLELLWQDPAYRAFFLTALDGYADRLLRPHKQSLFSDLPPTVVEPGSGVGANLRYLPAGTRLIAVEPNPAMHARLRARAARARIDLDLHATVAQHLDLPDGSVDAVISSLVPCTVTDPAGVVSEVHRVLRPSGRYAFLEHVAAAEGSALRHLQRAVRRPWSWAFEGCSCERDLRPVIEAAGFARTTVADHWMHGPFLPANTQIAGVATKGG